MKRKFLLKTAALIFVFTLPIWGGISHSVNKPAYAATLEDKPERWEYKVVLLNEKLLQGDPAGALNLLGADGWELVTVSDTVTLASPTMPDAFHVLYFKRKLLVN